MSTKKINLDSLLCKMFPHPEYCLLGEVSDKAGFHRSRSADFIAMALWPSRGLSLHGIEVKSGRGDWLKELKNPQKAENIFQYCDCFWLCTDNEGVANLPEIPETWGWIHVKGKKLVVMKQAPKLTPVPISRHFLAALLKRAGDKSNYILRSDVQPEIDAAFERGKVTVDRSAVTLKAELDKLQKMVHDFEKATDMKLNKWFDTDNQRLAKTVNAVRQCGPENIQKRLTSLKETAEAISADIQKSLNNLQTNEGITS